MALGVNTTEIVHLAPAASELGQALLCAKSPGLAPVTLMLVIVKGVVPELVRVTVCALL